MVKMNSETTETTETLVFDVSRQATVYPREQAAPRGCGIQSDRQGQLSKGPVTLDMLIRCFTH